MADKEKCEQPARHKAHMCKLKKDGRMDEYQRHGEKPIVYCNKCRVQANDPLVVCNPRSIKPAR